MGFFNSTTKTYRLQSSDLTLSESIYDNDYNSKRIRTPSITNGNEYKNHDFERHFGTDRDLIIDSLPVGPIRKRKKRYSFLRLFGFSIDQDESKTIDLEESKVDSLDFSFEETKTLSKRSFFRNTFKRRSHKRSSGDIAITLRDKLFGQKREIDENFDYVDDSTVYDVQETLTQRYMGNNYENLISDLDAIPFDLTIKTNVHDSIHSKVTKIFQSISPSKSQINSTSDLSFYDAIDNNYCTKSSISNLTHKNRSSAEIFEAQTTPYDIAKNFKCENQNSSTPSNGISNNYIENCSNPLTTFFGTIGGKITKKLWFSTELSMEENSSNSCNVKDIYQDMAAPPSFEEKPNYSLGLDTEIFSSLLDSPFKTIETPETEKLGLEKSVTDPVSPSNNHYIDQTSSTATVVTANSFQGSNNCKASNVSGKSDKPDSELSGSTKFSSCIDILESDGDEGYLQQWKKGKTQPQGNANSEENFQLNLSDENASMDNDIESHHNYSQKPSKSFNLKFNSNLVETESSKPRKRFSYYITLSKDVKPIDLEEKLKLEIEQDRKGLDEFKTLIIENKNINKLYSNQFEF
ncbi:hypothetical protein WICMUC_001492 [Wickerhamomyces mucosus]|uniref:Uncharacterized protein n=1 Tax=Wickerhamomyces mucosus TaxID=1378264 RepID=A0A9P8PVP0_9ASCO|nr:hypothetical protein WICMUC_001492 [Wickerhamomyces mucosus]